VIRLPIIPSLCRAGPTPGRVIGTVILRKLKKRQRVYVRHACDVAEQWLDDRFAGETAPTSCGKIPAGNSLEPERSTAEQ